VKKEGGDKMLSGGGDKRKKFSYLEGIALKKQKKD